MTDVNLGPAVVNLKGIVENDNWSIALTLTSGVAPYDLTAAVIVAKMKLSSGNVTLTTAVTDAANGKMTVSQTVAPAIGSGAKWALRINGAGTFIPQVKFSADPTGTILCKKDSYFLMVPLGTNTVASVGPWA